MLLYMSQPIHFSSSSLHYSYTAWTACISPHILKHIPLQYYAFINISLSHYNTTCMTWLWCDDLISYTFPLEWRIWLLPFPHNTSHFAPVLRFPALCFDIIRCSHGLRTPRERIFKKFQTFGLVQTNWAENFGGIWDIFGQNTAPILALWVPCPWFWVIGCFFLSTKNFGFQT